MIIIYDNKKSFFVYKTITLKSCFLYPNFHAWKVRQNNWEQKNK